jgi:hypothetical protein
MLVRARAYQEQTTRTRMQRQRAQDAAADVIVTSKMVESASLSRKPLGWSILELAFKYAVCSREERIKRGVLSLNVHRKKVKSIRNGDFY